MTKQFTMKRFFYLPVVLVISLSMLSGCAYVKEWNETPPILDVPQETVQQIDVLKLEEVQEKETTKVVSPEPELPEITLSLEECRALTLENNLDLHVQRINPSIARERLSLEEAKFEATFKGSATYLKTDSPSPSALQASKSENTYINLGVDMPLRTGGTISFGLADQYTQTDLGFDQPEYFTTDFSVSISQPLLRNAGKRANTYSIRVAQYNSRITDAQTKLQVIRIIGNVDTSYWRLYAMRKWLDVRMKQYDHKKALFEQTERFVEVGVKPRIEVIRTKASMAESLEAIIRAENDVRETERSLKRMLNKKGLGMETNTILIPSTLPDPIHYKFDRELMVKNAIENRMELLELEIRLAQDNDYIGYLKNRALPQATFDYKYNVNGLGSQRGDAYDLMFDNDHNDHRFGLQLSIPIGNKAAKSNIRRARYERAQRLVTKESKEDEIKNEVLNQIDKLEANWQRILASRQTTILRNEQYKAEKRQFELGLVTSTDVLDVQTQLADALRMEIVAITDYQITLINLASATGTLLGAAKVEWEPVVPVK